MNAQPHMAAWSALGELGGEEPLPPTRDADAEADRAARNRDEYKRRFAAQTSTAAQVARTGLDLIPWAKAEYLIRPGEKWVPVRYLADFMAAAMAPGIRRVALWKASQIGFSQALTAMHGWCVGERSQRVVLAMPTEPEARKAYRRFVKPMHSRVPRLRLLGASQEDRRSTVGQHRVYEDGSESLVQGAATADRYASFVCDLLILDELERYPPVEEGDAVTLSMRAVRNTGGRVVCGSTPTSAYGPSQILSVYEDSDITFAFAVACPECGALDDLVWERMKWRPEGSRAERAATVLHHCGSCGAGWSYDALGGAMAKGRWQQAAVDNAGDTGGEFPEIIRKGGRWVDREGRLRSPDGGREMWPEKVGFALWSAYSPWYEWPRMVADWLSAQGDARKLRAFTEQTLARPFGVEDEGVSEDRLLEHAIPLEELPDDHRLAICAVDVQQDWLAAHLFIFGPNQTGVLARRVDFHGEIDRVDGLAWQGLKQWLRSGDSVVASRPVRVLAIDVGFEQTWAIRNFRRLGFSGHRFAVKGKAGWGFSAKRGATNAPIDGARAKLWTLPVDNLKAQVAQAYQNGRLRLWDGHAPDIRRELMAERLIRNDRTKRLTWQKFQDRNEALDCSAYALAVYDIVRPGYDVAHLPLAAAPLKAGAKRRRRKVVLRAN